MCISWGRLTSRVRWPARVAMILVSNVAAVVTVGLVVNSMFTFYASWSELFGHHPRVGTGAAGPGALDASLHAEIRTAFESHHGVLVSVDLPAVAATDVGTLPAQVYLPAAYGDPAQRHRDFPVIELLDGFPGSPQTWVRSLNIVSKLDEAISSGTMAPTVVVLPTSNVAAPRDTECVDVPSGPQAGTYLTSDVRTAMVHDFRVDGTGRAWGIGGYSTGGYCAMILAAQHPSMFAAAASLEGYNQADDDSTTGDLFAGDADLRTRSDLLWWLRNPLATAVPLLAVSSRQDAESWGDMVALQTAASASVWPVDALSLPQGGHNTSTFSAEIPTALAWLSRRIGSASRPVPTIDGIAPSRLPSPTG